MLAFIFKVLISDDLDFNGFADSSIWTPMRLSNNESVDVIQRSREKAFTNQDDNTHMWPADDENE